LLALAVHLNAFGNGFVFDDLLIIRDNPSIRSLAGIPGLFTENYWGDWTDKGLYRPLVIATYALNYAAGGLHTAGYTGVNLLLHAGVTLLLVVLAVRLGASRAVAASLGLLFAVHPVHTEAVTGLVGRAETLAALAVVAALLAHRRAHAASSFSSARRWRLGAAACFLLALLSKENAIAFIVIAPIMDWLLPVRRRTSDEEQRGSRWSDGRLRADLVAYGVVIAVYLVARMAALGALTGGIETTTPLNNPLVARTGATALGNVYGAGPVQAKLTAIAVLGEYARLLLWPARLSCDYSYDQLALVGSPVDARFALGLLLLVLVIGGVLWLRRRVPLAAFGLALLAVTFAPSSNLPITIGTICGERLLYLPSAGFLLAVAALGEQMVCTRGSTARRVALAALVVLVALGAVRSWARNPEWRSPLSLWESAARAVPRSAKAHAEYGRALLDESDRLEQLGDGERARPMFADAISHLERALEIYPENTKAINALTRAELLRGDWQRALELCDLSIRITPADPLSHSNASLALMRLGDVAGQRAGQRSQAGLETEAERLRAEARSLYERAVSRAGRAIEIDPGFVNAYYNRAAIYRYQLGRYAEALADFRAVLRLDPDHPNAEAIRREVERLDQQLRGSR
jgi:tetratricopeptide (TPR) repeat protein